LGLPSPPSPVLCSATTVPCPSRVASRVARSPIPCRLPRFVSLLQARWPPGAADQRPGSWAAGTPALPASVTRRHLALPSSRALPVTPCPALRPRWNPASLALAHSGLPPSARSSASAFPRLWSARLSLWSTTRLISGLPHPAWRLAPSGSVLPSRGLHAEFATELRAKRCSDGT
jgi:hypothetical protein